MRYIVEVENDSPLDWMDILEHIARSLRLESQHINGLTIKSVKLAKEQS